MRISKNRLLARLMGLALEIAKTDWEDKTPDYFRDRATDIMKGAAESDLIKWLDVWARG